MRRGRRVRGPRETAPARGRLLVLYDGDCGLCAWSMAWLLRLDRAGRLEPVTIQSGRGQALLADLPERQRLESWHVSDGSGLLASAGTGTAVVLERLPAGAPLAALALRFPAATERAYRWVAAHRARLGALLTPASRARAQRLIATRMH
jgi:predicted DCC family thiol-disulfide oxidoreductase YuxK